MKKRARKMKICGLEREAHMRMRRDGSKRRQGDCESYLNH